MGGGEPHLFVHKVLDVVEGEGDGGVVVQQEGVAGRRVVVHHQLLHPPQHLPSHHDSLLSHITNKHLHVSAPVGKFL
jgi:hypothetical protein